MFHFQEEKEEEKEENGANNENDNDNGYQNDPNENCISDDRYTSGCSASSRIIFLPVHPARSCRAVVAPRGRRIGRYYYSAILSLIILLS